MQAGTFIEHRILDALNILDLEKDKQVIKSRLRINLDGNTNDAIYEVKTHQTEKPFKVSKKYKEQVQVQMYGTSIKRAYIVSYGLEEEDYNNFYRDIDQDRLKLHEIKYDVQFINEIYLPRFNYLSECLDKGEFPKWSL